MNCSTHNTGNRNRNKIRPITFNLWKTVSGVGDCVYNALEAINRGTYIQCFPNNEQQQ